MGRSIRAECFINFQLTKPTPNIFELSVIPSSVIIIAGLSVVKIYMEYIKILIKNRKDSSDNITAIILNSIILSYSINNDKPAIRILPKTLIKIFFC